MVNGMSLGVIDGICCASVGFGNAIRIVFIGVVALRYGLVFALFG